MNIIEKSYKKILAKCQKKENKVYLYLISFLESIIFPIPTDIFLVPYILASVKKYISIAFLTTFFSVLGGCVGYFIGYLFWEESSVFIINYYPEINTKLNSFIVEYNKYGILLVIVGGFSPFPYKITCLASGFLGVDFILFFIFSFISRGARFFLVCYLLFRYQEKANELIPKYIGKITILIIVILIFYILVKNI